MHLPHRLRDTIRSLYELGDLSWKLDEHQDVMIYREYRKWQKRMHKDSGAFYLFMLDCARQTGKSHCISIIRLEDCFQTPGGRYLYGAAEEINVKEYVLPNIEGILEDCPEDLAPKYKERFRGTRAHYAFPNKCQLKIVGVDKDPGGLRGPRLHGFNLDEAAFIDKLKQVVSSILWPQMQRIQGATGILSSSAPDEVDHDFDTVFKPSCESRKAYVFMTIEDNTALTREAKDKIIEAAREIDEVDAERELFGKRVRSAKLTVFPEFSRETHVLKEYKIPQYGLAMASYDPGQKHLFAASWSVYDFMRATVVFVDDWAVHNASTEQVAAVSAAREYDLFGTLPSPKLKRLELGEWEDHLRNDRCEHLGPVLYEMLQEERTARKPHTMRRETDDLLGGRQPSEWQWYDNDARGWRPNPQLRVSDCANPQFMRDMSVTYDIHIDPCTKDDLREVMVQHVRSMLKQRRVLFGPLAILSAAHVNACTWNEKRTEWVEHKTWSHFDVAATNMYGLRFWENYYQLDPFPPKHLGRGGDNWVGNAEVIEQQIEYGEHW